MYPGVPSYFWSGYQIVIFDEQGHMLYNSPEFAIDHLAPSISTIILSSSGQNTGLLGIASPLKLSFDASELLTGIHLLISSGQASLISQSGTHYEYGILMNSTQTA